MSIVSDVVSLGPADGHCPHENLIYFFCGMLADTMLCSDACDWTIYMYKTTCRVHKDIGILIFQHMLSQAYQHGFKTVDSTRR